MVGAGEVGGEGDKAVTAVSTLGLRTAASAVGAGAAAAALAGARAGEAKAGAEAATLLGPFAVSKSVAEPSPGAGAGAAKGALDDSVYV